MPDPIDLLRRRRSLKPNELGPPGPSTAELETLLTIASRVPDHGKLAPWRFVVFEGEAREEAGRSHRRRLPSRKYPEANEEQIAYERTRLARAPLVIAVVSRAAPARQNPGVGAGALGRRRRHEPRARPPMRWATGRWIAEVVRLSRQRARCAGPRVARRIAGFVHIEPTRRRARGPARGRRSPRSSPASGMRPCSTNRARETMACRTTLSRRSLHRVRSAGSPR